MQCCPEAHLPRTSVRRVKVSRTVCSKAIGLSALLAMQPVPLPPLYRPRALWLFRGTATYYYELIVFADNVNSNKEVSSSPPSMSG